MSTPVEGGRPLLRGRLFGVPVHLDASFVLMMALLGFFRTAVTVTYLSLWLVIATLAVLTHELGHAAAARMARANPQIALVGFGGVTTFTPPEPLSRARSLGISLAGPAVGLVIGGAAWLVLDTVGPAPEPGELTNSGWPYLALWITRLTCLGWSLLNLLPILPLDGGQAMRELLPGDEATRSRRAAVVSVVVALAAALAAYLYEQPYVALFLVFFGVSNALALRPDAAVRGPGDQTVAPGEQVATPEQAVVALLWRNDPAAASRVMQSLPPEVHLDLAVTGAVLALSGDPRGGHALLRQELQRRPGDVDVVALLVLTQALEHDWDALLATLHGPLGPGVPQPVVERAITEATGVGREDVAGRITARHGSA